MVSYVTTRTNHQKKIKIGYYIVNVQPYIPNPLRCFQCQKFGHSKKWCKNKPACWKCGSEGHYGSDCTSETVCCLNCKGEHYASSKSCPVWIQEKEIQRVKTEKSLTYGDARKLVRSSSPSSSSVAPSYASAAKTSPKKVSMECQTPSFWIGPQPSLLEASRLPSVQTVNAGSGTHDTTSSSTHQTKTNVRNESPAKSDAWTLQKQEITITCQITNPTKQISLNIESENRYKSLSSRYE